MVYINLTLSKKLIVLPLLFLAITCFTLFAKAQTISQATGSGWNVTWYDCTWSLTKQSCKVAVQNLDSTTARDFDLSVLISNTNYDLSLYTTEITLKEWKAVPKEVPVYVTVEKCDYQVAGNDTQGSPILVCWNETVQNGTVTKNVCDWKVTKTYMFKEGAMQKQNFGLINIPKLNSKVKYDDYDNIETVNGTKFFIIEWTTPITLTSSGYGSFGKIAFFEESSNTEFHPWWNSTWHLRRNITIYSSSTRTFEPIEIFVDASSWEYKPYNDSIRITTADGVEIPSYVYNITQSNGIMSSFTVGFEGNLTSGNTTFYMYYDTASKGDAGYSDPYLQYDSANYRLQNRYIRIGLCGNNAYGGSCPDITSYGGKIWLNFTEPDTGTQYFPTDYHYYHGIFTNAQYSLVPSNTSLFSCNAVFCRVNVYYRVTNGSGWLSSHLNISIELWAHGKTIIHGKLYGKWDNTNPNYVMFPYIDVDNTGGTWVSGAFENATGVFTSYDMTSKKKWIWDNVNFPSPRQSIDICFVQPDWNTLYYYGRFWSSHDDGYYLNGTPPSNVYDKAKFYYFFSVGDSYSGCQNFFNQVTTPLSFYVGSEEPLNQPPNFNDVRFYRSFKSEGNLSYCGSDKAFYSSGTNSISASINVKDISQDYYLIVRHIKNSNTLSYYVNDNLVGSSSSAAGTACNNNFWITEKFLVPAGNLTANPQTITIVPSGTDNNYVDYIALIPTQNTTLFGKSFDIVTILNVTDDSGLDKVNNTVKALVGNNSELFYDFWNSGTTDQTLFKIYYANDTSGLSSKSNSSLIIDTTAPSITEILADNIIINFNESSDSLTFKANITDVRLDKVLCFVDDESLAPTNSSDEYSCTKTFTTNGSYVLNFTANDTVENTNSITKVINVSKVVLTRQQVLNESKNFFEIPFNSSAVLHPENTAYNYSAWFGYNFSAYVNTSFEFSEDFYWLIEVSSPRGNITDGNYSAWWDGQTFYWNDSFNETKTKSYFLEVSSENISTYWQNDAVKMQKRFFRINTYLSYNDTLKVKLRLYLPQSYDPYNYHSELWECDVPSTAERYSCSGSWYKIAEGSGSNTEYLEYTTTLSDKLLFVDVEVGPQIQQSGSGGGLAVVQNEISQPSQQQGLPDLGRILLTPLFGLAWLTPLTLGIAVSIIYLIKNRVFK